jgi:hypothetical protein
MRIKRKQPRGFSTLEQLGLGRGRGGGTNGGRGARGNYRREPAAAAEPRVELEEPESVDQFPAAAAELSPPPQVAAAARAACSPSAPGAP